MSPHVAMSTADIQARIGPALVDYAGNGKFPDEESVSAANIEDASLPGALVVLHNAQTELETEIRQISRQTIPNVEAWITNARAVHEDIERLRRLATQIVREAEADQERLDLLDDRSTHLELLERENLFNKRLGDALQSIQLADDAVDKAEQAACEQNILGALRLLAGAVFSLISNLYMADILQVAWEMIDNNPISRTRALRLVDDRCFALKRSIHKQLTDVWGQLLYWNRGDKKSLTINATIENGHTSLEEAVTSWTAFKELEGIVDQIWQDLDDIIIKPRIGIQSPSLSSISILGNTLSIGDRQADTSIKSLFDDLEGIIRYLLKNLPTSITKYLSEIMMPIIFTRLKEQWLDPAVPSSLADMDEYQQSLAQVNAFAATLESLNWHSADGYHDWASNAHKIWLSKRKETALDWTRNQLSLGVGTPTVAYHSEKKMVTEDGDSSATPAGNADATDWDAGWDSDEKDEPTAPSPVAADKVKDLRASQPDPQTSEDDDDAADAWGWGDDDTVDEPIRDSKPAGVQGHPTEVKTGSTTREVTLSEPYWVSSIPAQVFNTVTVLFGDGAELTKPENEKIPVAPAAAGLFSIPTQILAMYRAVSPHYYSRNQNGNMYTYNDTIWLCDKFREFISTWDARQDLTPRTRGLVKLNPELEKLVSFGKRAYTNELVSQRTVVNDFLGGTHNFLDGSRRDELEQGIQTVISHIQTTSESWKKVLSYSAWASAVGSLVNAVAKKIISDVFDRDDLGADEANLIAELISKVTSLDELFIPDSQSVQGSGSKNGTLSDAEPDTDFGTAPLTARFADKWLKMQYLGEVLQSNLANIRFLWFESGLSLEFTKEEVIDLIMLSFENNPQVRGLIKEIKESKVTEMEEQW